LSGTKPARSRTGKFRRLRRLPPLQGAFVRQHERRPRHSDAAKGTSVRGVKIRTFAVFAGRRGSTNVVSE